MAKARAGMSRNAWFAPMLILLLAAGLRFWGLGQKSLWLDEIMTVTKASLPFSELREHLTHREAHPPLFQTMEWAWLRLGRGDGFARIPSAIAGVAVVAFAMLAARRLFGRRVALAAGLLLAVSQFQVYYSQDARLYTLMTALTLLQLWLLTLILARRGRAGWGLWAAYGAAGLLCLYTYVLCVFTVGAMALAYLWAARRRRQWVRWVTVHVVMGAAFLPWVPVMRKVTSEVSAALAQSGGGAGRPTMSQVINSIATWVAGMQPWRAISPAGILIGVAALFGAGFIIMLRRGNRPWRVLAPLFVLPLVAYVTLPMPRIHIYEPKHLMFLQPVLLIALAAAWRPQLRRWRDVGVVVMLILLLLNLWALSDYFRPSYEKEDWRGLARDVQAQLRHNDLVIFNPGYVGYAFNYYAHAEATASADWLLEQSRLAPEYRRVWLVQCNSPVSHPTPAPGLWLVEPERNWNVADAKKYEGAHGVLAWVLFERGGAP